MISLTTEIKMENLVGYFDDIDIDLIAVALKDPKKLRATITLVGVEGRPVINIFDDAKNITWCIQVADRKIARCKNGKWSRFYDADTLDEIKPTERLV